MADDSGVKVTIPFVSGQRPPSSAKVARELWGAEGAQTITSAQRQGTGWWDDVIAAAVETPQ